MTWSTDRLEGRLDALDAMYDRLDEECDHFQWGLGDTVLGEVSVDREANRLQLNVFVLDTDKDFHEDMDQLRVTIEVDPYEDPRQQIRGLIHFHLTHEADEQMRFRGEQTFYPHNEDGSLK
jgi:hypothetical protein